MSEGSEPNNEEGDLDGEGFVPEFENECGDWLRTKQAEKNINVQQLSEESGVSVPAIYNILGGKSKNPQQKTRERLGKALGSNGESVPAPAESIDGQDSELGELVDFDPYAEADLPECRGVYVFYDISDRPVYVGKVSGADRTIRKRVGEHYEKFWFKAPIVNNAAYIKIEDEVLCSSVEKALIKFLKTNAVLNKRNVSR